MSKKSIDELEETFKKLTKEQVERIEKIISEMKCRIDFRCYKSHFEDICKAKNVGMEEFLECHDETPTHCQYSLSYGDVYFCHCPLRNYLAREIGV